MVNDDPSRWENDLLGLQNRIDEFKNGNLKKFDQQFVHQKPAEAVGEAIININLGNEDGAFYAAYNINGHIVFPAAGYMSMAWRAFAKMIGSTFEKTAVVFDNVIFHRAIIFCKEVSNKFSVKFLDGINRFTICEGGSLVVSGEINVLGKVDAEQMPLESLERNTSGVPLNSKDVYMESRLRGCDQILSINEIDLNVITGKLRWDNNWVGFINRMMQFGGLQYRNLRELFLPNRIECAIFNPAKHVKTCENLKETDSSVPIYVYKKINVIKSGGIEIQGLTYSSAPRRPFTHSPSILERYVYIPLKNANHDLSETTERARLNAISVLTHLAIENNGGALKIKVVDFVEGKAAESILAPIVKSIIENEPKLTNDVAIITNKSTGAYEQAVGNGEIRVVVDDPKNGPIESNCHLIIAYDVVSSANANVVFGNLKASVKEDGFILLEENVVRYDGTMGKKLFATFNMGIVSVQRAANKYFILLRQFVDIARRKKTIVDFTKQNFSYVEPLKAALANAEKEQTYVYIVAQDGELLNAVGFMNSIKNENGGKFARLIIIQDANVEPFSFTSKIYTKQLKMDLISNVYKKRSWGTFRLLSDNPNLEDLRK